VDPWEMRNSLSASPSMDVPEASNIRPPQRMTAVVLLGIPPSYVMGLQRRSVTQRGAIGQAASVADWFCDQCVLVLLQEAEPSKVHQARRNLRLERPPGSIQHMRESSYCCCVWFLVYQTVGYVCVVYLVFDARDADSPTTWLMPAEPRPP
jgi:hypothetical protein